MKCTLIAVGSELVAGDVVNTNTTYLAQECQKLGIQVLMHFSVGDDEAILMELFKRAYEASDLVILSGGLGPTYDDMTREAVAKVLQRKLVVDSKSKSYIDNFFNTNGFNKTKNNDRQALIIEGSEPLYNKVGLATGSFFKENEKCIILLPGPPHEMEWVFENEVRDKLIRDEVIASEMIHFFNIGEAELEDRLSRFMKDEGNLRVAPYAKGDSVIVKVTVMGKAKEEVELQLDKTVREIIACLKDVPYHRGEDNIPLWIIMGLNEKQASLAVAESCTGGLLSNILTDIDGASEVYLGGVCAYQEGIKQDVLDVLAETIKSHTVYSHEVVLEMARGAKALFSSDYAIATSGIVGKPEQGAKKGSVYYAFVGNKHYHTGYYEVPQGAFRTREALKFRMAKKILIDFYRWQKEND